MSGIPTAVLHFSAITQDQYDQAKASLSPQLYALKGTTVLTLNNQNAHWGNDSIRFDGGGAGVTTETFGLSNLYRTPDEARTAAQHAKQATA
jgi:hypothetical protein